MRTRITAAAVAAAALLTLTACSSGDDKPASGTDAPASTNAPAATSSAAAAGSPATLDAATRTVLMNALRTIDPALAADQDKAVSDGFAQCEALADDGDLTGHSAAQRFSTGSHPLSDAQGVAIDAALRLTLCRPPQ